MTAIMEDDKEPHHEPGSEHTEEQCQPVGDVHAPEHSRPEQRVGDQRIGKLPDAAAKIRLRVRRHHLRPTGLESLIWGRRHIVYLARGLTPIIPRASEKRARAIGANQGA